MRKTIIFCLIAAALAAAQQKHQVAVLPTFAEGNALDPQGQILLTDWLSLSDFHNLIQSNNKSFVLTAAICSETLIWQSIFF